MSRRKDLLSLLFAFVGILAVLAIYFAIVGDSNSSPRRRTAPTFRPSIEGIILARGSGTGTKVFYMDVPELCAGQRLDYVGNRADISQAGSVKFVVMQGLDEVRVTGPKELEREGDTRGTGIWSLEDDQSYTLTVYGTNAAWNFLVRCN
jgi:hypothetical protein